MLNYEEFQESFQTCQMPLTFSLFASIPSIHKKKEKDHKAVGLWELISLSLEKKYIDWYIHCIIRARGMYMSACL